MRSRFARIVDSIVLAVAVWLLSMLVVRFFLDSFLAVVVAASIFTLFIMFLVRLRGGEGEKERYFALKLADFFLIKDDDFSLKYFFNAFKGQYENAIFCGKKGFIRIKDTIVFVRLNEPLSLKRTVEFYTKALGEGAKTVVIVCGSAEKNVNLALERLTDIRLEVFSAKKAYRLLKSLNSLPKFEKTPYKKRIKEFCGLALSPKRSRGYLLAAVTLLIGAYYSQFWLYFLVCGAIATSLALLSRIDILGRKA